MFLRNSNRLIIDATGFQNLRNLRRSRDQASLSYQENVSLETSSEWYVIFYIKVMLVVLVLTILVALSTLPFEQSSGTVYHYNSMFKNVITTHDSSKVFNSDCIPLMSANNCQSGLSHPAFTCKNNLAFLMLEGLIYCNYT